MSPGSVGEFSWWSDADRVALISYLRSVPPIDGNPGSVEWTAMAKVLDRMDSIPIDAARRVDRLSADGAVGDLDEYAASVPCGTNALCVNTANPTPLVERSQLPRPPPTL